MRIVLLLLALSTAAAAAPSPPRDAHPRLFLREDVVGALEAQLPDAKSGAARAVRLCDRLAANPDEYRGYSNWNWPVAASSCGLAYQLTRKAEHAAAGLKFLRAILDDRDTVGDGAGGDAIVRSDSGYFIRVYAPYAAFAYDWLHDAPGMDAGLRAHARARFKAWIDWYAQMGYLPDEPGANYHAGYVFAKTLIAVAAAGEDGATFDAYWTDVVDEIYGRQIVGTSLAPGGNLQGGDWPEGWQYGPLSVLEYCLGARLLEEHGVPLPALDQFTSDLVLRFVYGMTPDREGLWAGGDLESDEPHARPNNRTLLAVIAGPSSDEAAAYAVKLHQDLDLGGELFPIYDALAEARRAQPADFLATSPPLWYLVPGTRTLFARSSWQPDAFWAVFTSGPHNVADHKQFNASNFAFTRGQDHLVIDPSPYGSLSSLTSNALTVASNLVGPDYTPSQTPWSRAELPWKRASASGVVAARADISRAFDFRETPTDVPFARRDLVFLPEGELVLIDRVRTDDPRRAAYLRFRTPGTFALEGEIALATVGASVLRVVPVRRSSGTPVLRRLPAGDCFSSVRGKCDIPRIEVGEFALVLDGPSMLAVHVLAGYGAGDTIPAVVSINDPSIDAAMNAGVVGVSVHKGLSRAFVVASSARDGVAGATLGYVVPAAGAARHVVFDAPEDGDGRSSVAVTRQGDRCAVAVTAGGPGALDGRPLIFAVGNEQDPCVVVEDKAVLPGSVPGGDGMSGGPGDVPDPPPPPPEADSGCSLSAGRSGGGLALLALLLVVARRRRRR
jgi:hypothetical protein